MTKVLFVIPARGGSKGIPNKNIKLLGNKPLIHYSIEYARLFSDDKDICVTTDCPKIAECAKEINYEIPFLRPNHLATDTAGTYDVLKHTLDFYESKGIIYDTIVLLQPTSPFRERYHYENAVKVFSKTLDMVVSVCESASNPYFNLFEEQLDGFLKICKGNGAYQRRQDVPTVYEYNGSIYIINPESLRTKTAFKAFTSIKKFVMEVDYSIDLDTPDDWEQAEYFLYKKTK